MLNLKFFLTPTVMVFVFVSLLCIKRGQAGFSELYQGGYNAPNYKSSDPFGYERSPPLDRISMSFIKRANKWDQNDKEEDENEQTGQYLYNMLEAKLNCAKSLQSFDRYGFKRPMSHFFRTKRSADVTHAGKALVNNKKERLKKSKQLLDSYSKDSNIETDSEIFPDETKRYFDRVSSGLGEKDLVNLLKVLQSQPDNSILNINYGNLKDVTSFNDKETEANSEEVKSTEFDAKRVFDRLSSNLIKKSTSNKMPLQKDNFDVINKEIIEPQDEYNYAKQHFNSEPSNFVNMASSRDNSLFKRTFDRLSSGFVKRNLDSNGMFMYDTNNNNLATESFQKPDSKLSGSIDKDSKNRNNNHFDNDSNWLLANDYLNDNNSDFVEGSNGVAQKSNNEVEKRRFDRLSSGFVKRVTKDDPNIVILNGDISCSFAKRNLDRLLSGFLKRSEAVHDNLIRSSIKEKRYFDRIDSGFVKRDDANDGGHVETRVRNKCSIQKNRWNLNGIGYGLTLKL